MEVRYDKETDVANIQLSSRKPDGGMRIAEGVILHTASNNELVAIEILNASKKLPIKSLYWLKVSP